MKQFTTILLRGMLGMSLSLGLQAAGLYHAVVAKNPDSQQYASITEALAQAPVDDSAFSIYIKPGTYRERLTINRANVHLIGAGRDQTIILDDTSASTLKPDGKPFGTSGSRVVEVNAPDFSAQSLTIRNDFDYLANDAKDKTDPTRLRGTQAVALILGPNSDRSEFYDVSLEGYQDTFYTKGGRSYFAKSRISGTVDFIFGNGNVVFDDCDIVARYRPNAERKMGYITAPSTLDSQFYGLTFINSRLLKEDARVAPNSYGLGRPWHPTRTFSDGRYADPNADGKTIYINTQMDDHIDSWDSMSGKDINGEKIWFSPDKDARFGEYSSTGAGAKTTPDRPQLTPIEAQYYTLDKIFNGWEPVFRLQKNILIQGQVSALDMQYPVHVTIKDQYGAEETTQTDMSGFYQVKLTGMIPPLVVSAREKETDCLRSDTFRGYCMAALYLAPDPQPTLTGQNSARPTAFFGAKIRVNINPLSDLMLSNVAEMSGYQGPQRIIDSTNYPLVFSAQAVTLAKARIRAVFGDAFSQLSLSKEFDPVTYGVQSQDAFNLLIKWLWVNHGYHTGNGEPSSTVLMDLYFHPLAVPDIHGEVEPFHLDSMMKEHQTVQNADHRVFIIGDSTASIYPSAVYPRMGWGQVFQQQFTSQKIQVVDVAQSGRSARLFNNQGWFRYLKTLMRPGDYLLIQMSHNDEKCDAAKQGRGANDVANLCAYPNDAAGQPQYPVGLPDMSFQHALESYVVYAKQHQITPVLLTPITRIKNAAGKTGFPIVKGHSTKQNSSKGYAFVGDYSQTVKDTAKANHIALLDVEEGTIALANQLGEANWKNYWLAVDPKQYPYYEGLTGRFDKPDTTHLQERGAKAVSEIVAQAIKNTPELSALAHYLN